ncbi:P-loop nucleoside triphosphate hydrolase, putative, partial [Rhizoctonia solani AG-3 Rhs1AP]
MLRNESTDEGLPWPFKSSTKNSSDSILKTNRPNTSEEWLDFAQKTIWEAATVTDAIQILAAEPNLLEFLITANEDVRDSVYEFVCGASFPTKRANWAASTSYYFLRRFQVYLSRLPPHLANRNIDDASRQTSALVGALFALDHITFGDGGAQEEEGEPEDIIIKVKSKKSQKQRKANKASHARNKSIVADPRLFTAVDMDLPTTADEVLVTEICILERIQETLKVLMTAFDNPNLVPHAKTLFFKQPLQYEPVRLAPKINATPVDDKTGTATGPEIGAYPHIRPLAAAKYFDEGTGLGAWNIIVSGRAIKDLRQIQKGDSHVFGMVYKKIMELSQGFFSDDNQKRLLGLDTEVPIYEAKVSRDLRIVYQIDLDTDVDAKVDKQIIKLYGVYTHAQLDNRLWALVSHYHINRRGKEYRRRCLHRETPRARGQNVTLPAHFKHEEGTEAPVELPTTNSIRLEGMTEQDFLDLHSLIALEKFIPMSQSLVTSILNDSDANHVFHVSAKEKEIIYHESACFVLGRSGTGKTTSILFKMIGIEKLFEQMEGVAKPRQVFVTQSRVLAQRVQEYYHSLVRSSSETVGKDSRADEQDEEVLADLDDEDASTFGLPIKYSMLEDKHFPLFVTYDQLCSLLEADFGLQFRRTARTKVHAAAEKRFALAEVADVKIDLDREVEVESSTTEVMSPIDTKEDLQQARRAAVTFEIFVAAYWPHFDFRLTKGLDPALVYSEFLGIIGGSELALQSPTGALSRDEYTSLSHRKSSFASQRDRVYDLYELYRKRKQFLGGYDSAERTHALVNALNLSVPGSKIDCLYVDEAQDNLLIDTKLLHSLSNNPHGIFMAGDTAQTISAGSSFRFEDLKAFLWRLEEQDEAVRCGKRNAIHPALFHLAVNYRSHGGIVDCASSVVQLISDLFPYSIDKLSKETGLIDGPKPLFFSGWDHDVVRFEQFLQGEADTRIDFGASQVILVRNEAARTALRTQVGEIGLILTLYESKGLEFDDVLLYNFFEDSVPSASTWRVILHGLEAARLGPVPRFDEIRHAVICTELKNLYVGLTRARNHCWIWDVSDKAEPMKLFWQEKDLVSLCGPKDPMPQLSVSSSEADWAKSGRLLFNKGLYPQAMFCFEKAGLLVERDIAGAYQARKDARLLLVKSGDRQTRCGAFKKAANDFLGCAFLSKGKQQISCYLRAAECYIQAEEWKSAAESYLSAEQFDLSARNFRRAGCFDEAVRIVKNYRDRLKSQNLVDEILGIARLEFLRKAEYQKASELFEDVEEQLEYMEDFGFDAARIHVLELHNRFVDAASVALQERNTLEGVRLLLLSSEDKDKQQAGKHAIQGLWTLLPYGAPVTPSNEKVVGELLRQLSTIEPKFIIEGEQRALFTRKALRMRGNEESTPGSGCKKSMKLFLRIFLRLEMFSALIRPWFRSWIVPPACFLVGVNTGSLQLGYRVQRKIFEGYVSKLHACDLVRSELTMMPPQSERSIVHDLVDYYGEQTEYALQGALVAIKHIVTRSLNIELNVLIDMSAPNRSQAWADMREKALDGLLVPRSWALDIIQKPAKKVQNGWEVLPFLDVLYEVLRRLKFEEDSGFYLFNGRMGIVLRGIMSLRICRLLYLIYHPQHKDKIRASIATALAPTAQASIHIQLCSRLSRTTSWPDLFSALAEGSLNRGADELIRLSFRHSKLRPRRLMHVRLISYENIKPELERALSFVTFNTARGPALNPEAKPFVLNQRSTDETTETDIQDPMDRQDGDEPPEAETDNAPSDDIFGGLVPAQLAFRMPPAAKPERKFTEDERRAGLRILSLYRKYLSRKHMRERHAVRIIWAYYTRYRRRTQVVSGSNEDSIRQFHLDYRRIIDDIECTLLLDRLHRHHTMVLQGPMPHVLVFLRGLEQVTQAQKVAVKKRLQKVQHEELEKVQSRMTLCTSLAKKFKKLIPSIQPESKELRSLTALKDKVSEVDAMRDAVIEAFGDGCISANLELHYSLGVKVIIMPSPEPTAPKPPKPELNTTDMDGLF